MRARFQNSPKATNATTNNNNKMTETINSSSQQCPPLPLLQNFETARRSNITQFVFDRKRHSAETVGERDKERRKEKKRSKDDEDGDGKQWWC